MWGWVTGTHVCCNWAKILTKILPNGGKYRLKKHLMTVFQIPADVIKNSSVPNKWFFFLENEQITQMECFGALFLLPNNIQAMVFGIKTEDRVGNRTKSCFTLNGSVSCKNLKKSFHKSWTNIDWKAAVVAANLRNGSDEQSYTQRRSFYWFKICPDNLFLQFAFVTAYPISPYRCNTSSVPNCMLILDFSLSK